MIPIVLVVEDVLRSYFGVDGENGNLLGVHKKNGYKFIYILGENFDFYDGVQKISSHELNKDNVHRCLDEMGAGRTVLFSAIGRKSHYRTLKSLNLGLDFDIELSCNVCQYQSWAIALGLGVFCTNPKNTGINLGHGFSINKFPLIPTKGFKCEHLKYVLDIE